jgi:hypothetical protein
MIYHFSEYVERWDKIAGTGQQEKQARHDRLYLFIYFQEQKNDKIWHVNNYFSVYKKILYNFYCY